MKMTIALPQALLDKNALSDKNSKNVTVVTFVTASTLLVCCLVLNIAINNAFLHYKWDLILLRNLCVLLYMSCAYLYIKAVIFRRPLKTEDLGHVFPALLYLINFIPLFLPQYENSNALNRVSAHASFLPNTAFAAFYYHAIGIYLLLQVNTLIAWARKRQQLIKTYNHPLVKWFLLCIGIEVYFLFCSLFDLYRAEKFEEYVVLFAIVASSMSIIVGFVIAQTRDTAMLQVASADEDFKTAENIEMPVEEVKSMDLPVNTNISSNHHDYNFSQIEQKVNTILVEKQLFLNHSYTIRMLSDDTGVQSYILSAFINRRYGMNYNDFINEYRIKFCIEKIKNEEWRYKTLEALSKESGFNNRNSFTLAFKKVMGVTPSDFLKQIKVD
ncbi:MAG: response regulator containing CheY-like receiver domain and AraC-type DNA-binding domain [Flavipsychrobacter sp.]|jgi:AraC-like DNA-binding protein|nr:response regulator containing CheY-like receiver domain and AraC-type DNA-binding domain [Flavipsychrobacter sp.]